MKSITNLRVLSASRFIGAFAALLAIPSASGTTYTWTRSQAATQTWTTSNNWGSGGVFVSGTNNDLRFYANTSTALANGTIAITNGVPGALTMNKLTLNGRGATAAAATQINIASSSSTWTLNSSTTPTVSLAGVNGTQALNYNVNANLALAKATVFSGSGTAGFTFSGLISGNSFGITKSGTSTLILTNSGNSYSGGTLINGGVLRFSNGSLGTTGSITVNGGSLQWGNGNNQDISARLVMQNSGSAILDTNGNYVTFASAIGSNSSSSLTKNGAGTVELAGGINNYNGATIINGGTLQIRNPGAINSTSMITVNSGGNIYFNLSQTNGTVTTPIELNGSGVNGDGALISYVEGGQITFSGPVTLLGSSKIQGYAGYSTLNFTNAIGGSGNLTFFANGAAPFHKNFMVLSGASNFTGDFYIENYASNAQVTLSGGANRLPTTAVVRLGAGQWNPATSSVLNLNGNHQTLAGLSDTGGSSLVGTRSVVNTSSTAAILTLNTSANHSFSGTIGGKDINGTTGNNLALVKSGTGTLTLSGTNTYTGDTTVTGGTLAVNGSSIAGTNKLHINGGKVDLTGVVTVENLSFAGVPQLAGTYSATGAGGTIASANFTGSGTLVVASRSVGDFEIPSLAAGSFSYGTPGTGWTLGGGAGVSSNGSSFTASSSDAPEGTQVLFLQGATTASRTVSIPAGQAGTYRIKLKAAQRFGNNQTLRITLNGTQIDSITPPNQFYISYTTRDVFLPVGNSNLLLESMVPSSEGDHTIFIDDLDIVRVSDPQLWSNPATWGGTVPAAGAHVDIPAGKIVVLDQNIIADSIIVRGTLRFDPTKDLTVTTCSLIAEGKALLPTDPKPEGRIEIGIEQNPFTKRVLITLTGGVCTNISNCTCAVGGHEMTDGNVISAINGGVLDIHGANNVGPVWTKLNATIQPGASSITLAEPVSWPAGAQIVITSSTSNPYEAEVCTVASVTNGGLTVNLTAGVKNMHTGVQQSHTRTGGRTWNLDLRAEVGLLTRNVTVQGDAASVTTGFGGHVMIMKSGSTVAGDADFVPGGRGYVENAEFFRMGRKAVKGKYPLHFHMLGDEGKGQYFKSNSVHRSYNRALVIHGTSYTKVENNFCYDHIGHGLMLEDGSERFNRITRNVVAITRRPPISERVTPSDNDGNPRLQASLPASYWITNPNNIVDDNVSAGSEGTGMWLLFPRTVVGLSFTDPRFVNMQPSFEPLGSMQRNVTHSSYCGLQTMGSLTQDHELIGNRGTEFAGGMVIKDMTLYANALGTYGGLTDFTDPSLITHQGFVFADCEMGIMQANNSLTEDSLAVADTGLGLVNNFFSVGPIQGAPRSFQISYDGPARVKDCHLVGFDGADASLLFNVGASFKHKNAPFSGMTYSHAGPPRIKLPDFANTGDQNPRVWGMVFRDLDGSTTGQANTSIISNHPFMRTPGDYQPSNWTHAYRSVRKFSHGKISNNAPFSVYVPVTVTREKAGEAPESFYYPLDYQVQIQLPLIVNEDYFYTFQFDQAPATSQPMIFGLGDVDPGDFVRLRIRDFAKAPGISLDSGTRVFSRAAVDNATSSSYFADTVTGDLWVKWFKQPSGAHDATEFRVSYAATYTPSVIDTDGDGMTDALERNPAANRNPFNASDLAFNFDTENNFEGWALNGMQAYVVNGGTLLSRTAGGAGDLTRDGLAINGSLVNSLLVRYQSEASGTFRLYWATSDNNSFSETRAVNAPVSYTANSGYMTTRFDLTGDPEWAGKTITALRLVTFGAAGSHTWIDYIRNESSGSGPLFVGSAGDHHLTTASNWVDQSPAANGDRLVFGSAVVDGILNLNNSDSRGGITLTNGLRHDITINGPQALTMAGASSGGGIEMSSAVANLTINSPYSMLGDANWNVGAGRTLTANSAISGGNYSLIKNGPGEAVLGAANTYTGATTIHRGLLQITNAAAVNNSSKITVNDGGQIYFPPSATNQTVTPPLELNGDGALRTFVEGGQLTFSGPVTLLGNSKIQGFAGNSTLNFTNAIGGTGNLTFFANGASLDHKNSMVLSGSNNFNGDLYIENYAAHGQVTLNGGADRLPTTAVVRIGSGLWNPAISSTLNLNGNNQTIAGLSDSGVNSLAGTRSVVNTSGTSVTLTLNTPANQSFSGTIGGVDINGTAGNNLALVKSGNGIQTLSGSMIHTGPTTVNGGKLRLVNQAFNSSGTLTIASGATLEFEVSNGLTLGKIGGTTITGSGTLVKSGSGLLLLDDQGGAKNVTFNMTGGLIDLQGGVLMNGGWQSGIWTNNKASMNLARVATLDLWDGNPVRVDALTGDGIVTISSAQGANWAGNRSLVVGVNGGSGIFTGNIAGNSAVDGGSVSITKEGAGTQTLSGANTYNGNTSINGGILSLGQINANNESSSVSITASAGAKLDLSFIGTDTVSQLFINGVQQPVGNYTSAHSSGAFTGSGVLQVSSGPVGQIAPPQGYALWSATNAATTTPDQDEDGDGVSNGVEYILGGNKNTNDSSKLPTVSINGDDMVFSFQRAQSSIDGTTAMAIRVGTELSTWPESYNVPAAGQINDPGVTVTKDTSPGFDTVTLSVPRGSEGKKFACLVVTPAP